MAKAVGYVHPSIAKVTKLSEEFLKKAHKIMRDKGYKLDSSTSSAEAQWMYEQEGSPAVWMHGWHGRGDWGTGKVVFSINIQGSDSTFLNSDFDVISAMDFELNKMRKQMLPDDKVKQYEENLKKAFEFLQNIEAYIVMVAITS